MTVLIVTGASKGIGAKICIEAAKAGWACVVNFASDAEGAARVVATIEDAGGTAIALKADVAMPRRLQRCSLRSMTNSDL